MNRALVLFLFLVPCPFLTPALCAQAEPTGRPHRHDAGGELPPGPGERLLTSRRHTLRLPLPRGDDAFFFTIFGDRTGGPAKGIEVLKQAVADVNLLDPDLVMTVGDLVQGYNEAAEWLAQMSEFKSVMNRLDMPWFPVAGNHDVYWRGSEPPPGGHEAHFETHFGPLWYAFEHKRCWFIVLYTDEGDPKTGEKNFHKPDCQRMSPEQLGWLERTLEKTRDAPHVFVFLHHPRWLGEDYGDDWERVHAVLARPGNVSAVFAGHIHRMRYDGRRDGIEYFALATTGGSLSAEVPDAGYLHHYNVVTVRGDKVSVTAIPVGAVMDARGITGELSDEVRSLVTRLDHVTAGAVTVGPDLAVDDDVTITIANPVTRPLEVTLLPSPDAPGWRITPDHRHARIEPGGRAELRFHVVRPPGPDGDALALPRLLVKTDYLARGLRMSLPEEGLPLEARPPALTLPPRPVRERVLALDGRGGALTVDHDRVKVPDGPLTVEGWLSAREFRKRQGFLCKTESCEFGIFVNGAKPSFTVHLDGDYATVTAPEPLLKPGRWHHLAGVFDGEELRLYVDGRLVAHRPASGSRTIRPVPLVIGADPARKRKITSHFPGEIDEVRLSRTARYTGKRFRPARRLTADPQTALLLHMDAALGPWVPDSSAEGAHARRLSGAQCRAAELPVTGE